jgi:hypothetical protein
MLNSFPSSVKGVQGTIYVLLYVPHMICIKVDSSSLKDVMSYAAVRKLLVPPTSFFGLPL